MEVLETAATDDLLFEQMVGFYNQNRYFFRLFKITSHQSKKIMTMMLVGFYHLQNRTTGSLPDRSSFLCRMVWNKECTF